MLLSKRERLFLTAIIGLLILSVFVLVISNQKSSPTEETYKRIGKRILILTTGAPGLFQNELDKLNLFYNGQNTLTFDVAELSTAVDVSPRDWNALGNAIFDGYGSYDAFVILHPLDTLTYTASGLSFMLENTAKPVILSTNAILATRVIEEYKRIPEVLVLDSGNGSIIRGCRAKKVQNSFISPLYPLLGKVGDDLVINDEVLLAPPTGAFKLLPIEPNKKVVVIKVFPGINLHDMVKDQRIFGIVLEAYNSGDIPLDEGFLTTVKGLIDTGTIIVSVSQTMNIANDSEVLEKLGVIPCGSMTTESAFAKLYLIVSQVPNYNVKVVSNLMKLGMRGEI